MGIIKKIFIIAIPAIIILLVIFELFFRIIIPASDPPRGFFDNNNKIYCLSNDKKEGLVTIGKFAQIRTKWKVNNMHWNYPIDYQLVEEKKLIAIIGDSFVEAFQVDVDKNFSYLLRKKLKNEYEVYSFGIAGAPLSQYLNVSRYVNKHFKPEILIFNIVSNDFDESIQKLATDRFYFLQLIIDKNGTVTETTPKPDYSFAQYSLIKRIIYKSALFRYLWFNLKITSIPNQLFQSNDGNFVANVDTVKVNKNEAIINIGTEYLVRTIREENPDKRIIFNVTGLKWMNQMMKSLAQKYNIEFIDLSTLLHKDFKENKIKYHSELDGHWNEYGHKYVASVLYQHLTSK